MPWFRIDDQMAFHAKVVAAGNAAIGLWARAGSWSASALTDGFVPSHMIAPLGTVAQAKKLVKVGLWSTVEGGYQFHQWTERQPFSKADVERKRADARDRMRAAREAKKARNGDDSANDEAPVKAQVAKNVPNSVERILINNERSLSDDEPPFSQDTQVDDGCSREHDANFARSSLNPNPTQPNKQTSTHPSRASHETLPGEREAARGPAVSIDAWKIIREEIPTGHPQAVKADLAIRAGGMLRDGTPETDIRAALALWLTKPQLGPGALPSLVSEIVRTRTAPARAAPGAARSDEKVRATLATGARLAAQAAANTQPAQKELT